MTAWLLPISKSTTTGPPALGQTSARGASEPDWVANRLAHHRRIGAAESTLTVGASPAVALLSSSVKKMTEIATK